MSVQVKPFKFSPPYGHYSQVAWSTTDKVSTENVYI